MLDVEFYRLYNDLRIHDLMPCLCHDFCDFHKRLPCILTIFAVIFYCVLVIVQYAAVRLAKVQGEEVTSLTLDITDLSASASLTVSVINCQCSDACYHWVHVCNQQLVRPSLALRCVPAFYQAVDQDLAMTD